MALTTRFTAVGTSSAGGAQLAGADDASPVLGTNREAVNKRLVGRSSSNDHPSTSTPCCREPCAGCTSAPTIQHVILLLYRQHCKGVARQARLACSCSTWWRRRRCCRHAAVPLVCLGGDNSKAGLGQNLSNATAANATACRWDNRLCQCTSAYRAIMRPLQRGTAQV